MKKFWLLFIIFFLIISTSIIKNSTKKIEDETFFVEENLRVLNFPMLDVVVQLVVRRLFGEPKTSRQPEPTPPAAASEGGAA